MVEELWPSDRYLSVGEYCRDYGERWYNNILSVPDQELEKACEILDAARRRGSRVFVCGNGGAAALAGHFACDHLKGIGRHTGAPLKAISLADNVALTSALANDDGYETIFVYQLASLAVSGDVLVAISCSGTSPNIVNAAKWAHAQKMHVVALTGFDGGALQSFSDSNLHVAERNYGVVEDVHQALMHILAQYVQHRDRPDAEAGVYAL